MTTILNEYSMIISLNPIIIQSIWIKLPSIDFLDGFHNFDTDNYNFNILNLLQSMA